MQHLNDETGETVVLAAQNGLHSQYLRVLPGTSVLRMHLPNGVLRPLLSSGTGHMLLSQVDDGTIRKFVRRYNADADIHQHVKVELLLEEIRGVREKGYAMSLNQVTPHSGLIATLLPTSPGEKPLVIGIGGFSDRLVACERRYVEAIRTAVRQYFGS
jgi:DNA-binding IclR family transcriptional regulator